MSFSVADPFVHSGGRRPDLGVALSRRRSAVSSSVRTTTTRSPARTHGLRLVSSTRAPPTCCASSPRQSRSPKRSSRSAGPTGPIQRKRSSRPSLLSSGSSTTASSSSPARVRVRRSSPPSRSATASTASPSSTIVQVLEDSEVYRGEAADGQLVAVKVARPEAAGLRRALAREAAILRTLDGSVTPRVMSDGRVDDRAYLAVEWLEGRDVSTTGRAFQARGETEQHLPSREPTARRVCGDPCPGRAPRRRPSDERARPRRRQRSADRLRPGRQRRTLAAELRPHERGGVGFFLEPEFAHARLDGHRPPRLNAMRRAVLGRGPALSRAHRARTTSASRRRSARCGGRSSRRRRSHSSDAGLARSAAVEAVLRRALAKEPGRAVPSVARASRPASVPPRARIVDAGAGSARAIRSSAAWRDAHRRARLRGRLPAPPKRSWRRRASVTYGAAGLAYGLLRLARAREDHRAARARGRVVAARSRSSRTSRAPSTTRSSRSTSETVGRSSPYHTLSGVHWVSACVSHARPTWSGSTRPVMAVASRIERPEREPRPDARPGGDAARVRRLIELGETVPSRRSFFCERQARDSRRPRWPTERSPWLPSPRSVKLRFLGIAHGWAGIVYALLRWREATGVPRRATTSPPDSTSWQAAPSARGRPALAASCPAGPAAEVRRLRAELVQRQRWIRPSLAGRRARSWRRGYRRAGNRRGARRPGPDGERAPTSAAGSPVVRMPCSPSTAEAATSTG